MDEASNASLQALANRLPQEPKSRRSKIMTVGTEERNSFCYTCAAAYRNCGTDLCLIGALRRGSSARECIVAVANHHGITDFTESDIDSLTLVLEAHVEKQQIPIRGKRVDDLHRIAGKRLAAATLDNYIADRPEQKKILSDVRDFVANIRANVNSGEGLVLNGPSGNGKDHLLISAARAAIQVGFIVCWKNGQDLLGEFRDRIGSDESEEALLAPMVSADVLVISDPLPPSGSLTDYQTSMIYRVLDNRYRDCKPTWCSMNVTSRKEADARIGVAIIDRLRHGALCLACNWPSFRKPMESLK